MYNFAGAIKAVNVPGAPAEQSITKNCLVESVPRRLKSLSPNDCNTQTNAQGSFQKGFLPLLPLKVKASFPVKVNKSQQPNFHLHHWKSQFTTDAANVQNVVQILLKVHKVFQNGQHWRTQKCPLFLSLGATHNHRKKNPCLQFLLYAHELGTFAVPNDGFPIFTLISSKIQDRLPLTLNHVFTVIKPAVLISHMQDHVWSPLPTLLFVWPYRKLYQLLLEAKSGKVFS